MRTTRPLLTLLLGLLAALATGQPLNYAATAVEVRVGVLLIDSQRVNGAVANPAPFVWANLDKDTSVRPARIALSNPLAPTVLTAGIRARWALLDASTPVAGTRVTRETAPYWEVRLADVSDEVLATYDVLVVSLYRGVSLTAAERDRLRRFVDQGGVLWADLVDDVGGTPDFDIGNPLPVPFGVGQNNGPVDANLEHPLMRFPNALSLFDLQLTENPLQNLRLVSRPLEAGDLGSIPQFLSWLPWESARLVPVAGIAGNAAQRTVSTAQIGQGAFVLTTRGVTANLNRGVDPANPTGFLANRGYTARPAVSDPSFVAAAKLAFNVVAAAGASTSAAGNSRRSGSNSVDVSAPMLRRFIDDQGGGTFRAGQEPALFKGRVVLTKGNRVYVYDGRPDRDLDFDGNPDDGAPNPVGVLGDLVYQSAPLGGASRLSAPTVVESPDTLLASPDQVWVMGDNGQAFVLPLDPTGDPLNQPALATLGPLPGFTPDSNAGPFAPTVHEGLVVLADTAQVQNQTAGRLWVADLARAQVVTEGPNTFTISSAGRTPPLSSEPTVGYIPILDGSGGADRVVYCATQPSTGVVQRPAGLISVWLGARGENPDRKEITGNSINLFTRASRFGLPLLTSPSGPNGALGLKVTIIKPTGEPFTRAELEQTLDGTVSQTPSGVINLGLRPGRPPFDYDGRGGNPANVVSWRIDYTIDWSRAGQFGGASPDNYVRGNLELPDDTNLGRRIVGSPAIGPTGAIFVTTTGSGDDQSDGGTFYAFREDRGPGQFSMAARFDLYRALEYQLNTGAGTPETLQVPTVFGDTQDLVRLFRPLDTPMFRYRFVGGPVVKGQTVYAMANAVKDLGFAQANTGVLVAFKADPPTPSFEIEGQESNFTLVQPDPSLSTNKRRPEQFSQLQPGQFTVEPIPGTTRSRVILGSLMNVVRGRVRDSISTSLPVIVRRAGSTDTVVEPDALQDNGRFISGRSGGRWSPILWYNVVNGFAPGSAPRVAGETIYLGGLSVLPSILSGIFPPRFNGLIFAQDANLSPNDEFLVPDPARPWQSQLWAFRQNANPEGPFDVRPATAVKWPQFRGITEFDDLRIRVNQAALPENEDVLNLAIGDSTLAVTSENGLYVFAKSDFLVADSGRVSRFDPSGNPVWTTDQTFQAGSGQPTGTSNVSRQLSEPNRVYPADENGSLIVDTGSDRIVRVDAAAREVRTVTGFIVDPRFVPTGLPAQGAASGMQPGASRSLSRPKDVLSFETVVRDADNPFSNARPVERWVHYLIADSGNRRVVEVVDRYELDSRGRNLGVVQFTDIDGRSRRALGVLYWHSPEELSGKDYAYTSIGRVRAVDPNDPNQQRTIVALGFGNVEVGRGTFGLAGGNEQADRTGGNGGIVLYDGSRTEVLTEFVRPPIAARTFLGEIPGQPGQYDWLLPSLNQEARTQKLVGLSSVTLRYVPDGGVNRLAVMFTDATGVYEVVQRTAGGPWETRWMLPAEAYVSIRRPRSAPPYDRSRLAVNATALRPTFARRLDSGDVLVVNGYVGQRFDGRRFQGEVVMLDGSFDGPATDPGYALTKRNLGFTALSVLFELPPVVGARGLVAPVFAQRQ